MTERNLADRMAFLAALIISETEEAMAIEVKLPGGTKRRRHRSLEKLNSDALEIFRCYDRNLDKAEIYDKAVRCLEAINGVLGEPGAEIEVEVRGV